MSKNFVLGAQVSTGHSSPKALGKDRVRQVLQKALAAVRLDILIIGWEELPDLYRMVTDSRTRFTDQVYLWYPVLSDYPGMKPDHLVINYQGIRSQGWGDFLTSGEITETFRFACPNKPETQQTSLSQLERLLTTYPFDGVFLDKIRFPSPVNGVEEMFSCFCPDCYEAARKQDLNLDEVKDALGNLARSPGLMSEQFRVPGGQWLEDLLVNQTSLAKFIRFRANSITRLVDAVHRLTTRLGKKLALDIFTPGLSMLVGQDYPALAPYGVWTKPMIYRFAKGPAGLRLELPALAEGVSEFLGIDPNIALSWVQQRVPGLAGTDFKIIASEGTPLELIAEETRKAVALMTPTPIYLGLETVSMPGIINITPENVRQVVDLGRSAGVAGLILSWDLMHTPIENLQPLQTVE